MSPGPRLQRLRQELGATGLAGLALLGGALLFLYAALQPLEERNQRLERRLEQAQPRPPGSRPGLVRAGAPATAQLAAFYAFLDTGESTPAWLARLHAIGAAAGVQLRSAEYRLQGTGTRVERYEIALPVTGSYAQLRTFLEGALGEIPLLSLDGVSFSRQRADQAQVRADLRLTLHLVQP